MPEAAKFLARYLLDTLARIKAFQKVRVRDRAAEVVHADSRTSAHGGFDAILTSPPYPGLIDYHEQHRYAYELLGLDDRRDRELGAAALGTSKRALADYVDGISRVLVAQTRSFESDAPVIIVVNDRRDLYPEILERSGLRLVHRLERTSIAERAVERASITSRCSSLYGKRKRSGASRSRPIGGSLARAGLEKGVGHEKALAPALACKVVACLALLVALGGTGMAAATQLARNTVGTRS